MLLIHIYIYQMFYCLYYNAEFMKKIIDNPFMFFLFGKFIYAYVFIKIMEKLK